MRRDAEIRENVSESAAYWKFARLGVFSGRHVAGSHYPQAMHVDSDDPDRLLRTFGKLAPEVIQQFAHALRLVLIGRMSPEQLGQLGEVMEQSTADVQLLVTQMRDCMIQMELPPVPARALH